MKKILSLFLVLAMVIPFASCGDGDDSSSKTPASSSEESSSDWEIEERDGYRIAFISDLHLFGDTGSLFGLTDAQRTMMAVQAVLYENEQSPVDLVVIPGDHTNNGTSQYSKGTFDSWEDFEYGGEYYSSKYQGIEYPKGEAGTKNDPWGVLRMLAFQELLEPLDEEGIPYIVANGNHDCYRDEMFEMAFKMNHKDGYIYGDHQYETDEDGNLLVKDYKIEKMKFSFVDKVISPSDPEYEYYAKGYGQHYTFEFDENTAFAVFDIYHNEGAYDKGKWVESGFIVNASGRSWGQVKLTPELVARMFESVEGYDDIYVVAHCLGGEVRSNIGALVDEVKNNPNVVCMFDGHTHLETTTANSSNTGRYCFTCGYFSIPMKEHQANFKKEPFSFRMLDNLDGILSTYTILVENDYPAYTFSQSSGAKISAFYQPYTKRNIVKIRESK